MVFMMLMVFVCHSLRVFCASSNSSWRGSISAFSSSTRCIACAYCLTACLRSWTLSPALWIRSWFCSLFGLLAFWMSWASGSVPASFSHFSLCSIHFDCFSSCCRAISLSFLVPCHGLIPSIGLRSGSLFSSCLSSCAVKSCIGVRGECRPSDNGSFRASWQVTEGSWC